MQVGHNKGLVK